jgi:GTP cyclohydrolase I
MPARDATAGRSSSHKRSVRINVIAATVRASAADEAGRPTRFDAEQAVRTLIRWAGDDPNRAQVIQDALVPQGVAVVLKASHHCLSSRGVRKHDSDMVTSRMLGCFRDNSVTRQEFLALVE